MKLIALLPFILILVGSSLGKDSSKDFKIVQKPFRMGKLNLLWEKASKRLLNEKLVKLHSELKVHDVEELTFKKLKAAGGDKDGMGEAALTKKLLSIANRYSLTDQYSIIEEDKMDEKRFQKFVFKDKKLNKLWDKAEQSGLTQLELKALKEEFQHHQEKIDEYNMLITQVGTSLDPNEVLNDIHGFSDIEDLEEKNNSYNENINAIRDKHRELKTNMDSLVQKSHGHDRDDDFTEPQAANLWRMALRADFSEAELDFLQAELKHFEIKLQKLAHLENNMNKVSVDKFEELTEEDKEKILSSSDLEGRRILTDRINKQKRFVNKMQDTLEHKIIARHSEL